MKDRARLLVVSHVLPFPGSSGQSQRVAYTMRAAMRRFHVTFLTTASARDEQRIRAGLHEFCDDVEIVPTPGGDSKLRRIAQFGAAEIYSAATGLKRSNFVIGRLEFTPERIAPRVAKGNYDCVLFEYWHAWRAARRCRELGVPTVLDTHNVLWRAYERQLAASRTSMAWWRDLKLRRYRQAEEESWRAFDGLVAINREEYDEIHAAAPRQQLFYAPMGIDLSVWPYRFAPASPPRVAYYGGLGSPHNQRSAFQCLDEIMPRVWERFPAAEFWAVGSNPPESLKARQRDPRVHVSGFVESVAELLSTMSVVLCPWLGRYGFRSRVVEVMAAGAPIIVSDDAIAGMDLGVADGVGIANNSEHFAEDALKVLSDVKLAEERSRLARAKVEEIYDVSQTYNQLIDELDAWLSRRTHEARCLLT